MTARDHRLLAERAAQAGADVAEASFRRRFEVGAKDSPIDVVTEVDRNAQEAVVDTIRAVEPEAIVVAEEDDQPASIPAGGMAWIVDPIDGTRNYVAGSRLWATSVAVVDDGDPVAAATLMPAYGDEYVLGPDGVTRNGAPVSPSEVEDLDAFLGAPIGKPAHDGGGRLTSLVDGLLAGLGDVRRVGCAQATLAMVASGELDAAVDVEPMPPWDVVGGAAIVERAGGRVTDLDGQPWRHDAGGLIASNGRNHDAIVELVGDIFGE